MFSLLVVDEQGERHQIGSVKIGHVGLQAGNQTLPGVRSPAIPPQFDALPPEYFSLGQGEDYYESLDALSEAQRQRILNGLNDCAYDLALFERVRAEPSMTRSLLRSVSAGSVTGRLNRLTRGLAELTSFTFVYTLPPSNVAGEAPIPPPNMDFHVVPNSDPPTNVHVLIGRNGVGKSRAMRGLVRALLNRHELTRDSGGAVHWPIGQDGDGEFSSLVLVSFSAFDDFAFPSLPADPIPIEVVGLQNMASGTEGGPPLTVSKALAIEFRKSLQRCRTARRAARWREAIEYLSDDDLFRDAGVAGLIDGDGEPWERDVERIFGLLSSGHAIVLLTITRLIEKVDERTLVLIDEPEGHLHPPLLSAFIRSLSRLLVLRNGVAIVATHSPVALQEVPRSCVWKLRRAGHVSEVERPVLETFGENVGVLTREVFGLEVTRTGFHRLLAEAVFHEGLQYEQVLNKFGQQLGTEARAIVRALVLERQRPL